MELVVPPYHIQDPKIGYLRKITTFFETCTQFCGKIIKYLGVKLGELWLPITIHLSAVQAV